MHDDHHGTEFDEYDEHHPRAWQSLGAIVADPSVQVKLLHIGLFVGAAVAMAAVNDSFRVRLALFPRTFAF